MERKGDELELKCVLQKLKKHKYWFEIKDIYDGAGTNGKCVICYSNYRNTIFLSCRHSCCCQKCAATLSPKDCPLCKNVIHDIICLDNDKSIDNTSMNEENENENENTNENGNENHDEVIIVNDND